MIGTIAVTDFGWYEFLFEQGPLDEVNFWRPSARLAFRGESSSPFLFKLKSPHNSICGFGFFNRYSAIPIWLAWDAFEERNGCRTKMEMLNRITKIRRNIQYVGSASVEQIGCILISNPVFFPKEAWIPQPEDWAKNNLTYKRYDLAVGEGKRIWDACLQTAAEIGLQSSNEHELPQVDDKQPGYGRLSLVRQRLGQGTFRVAVLDNYNRGCAVTDEHSLPALEAAHIKPYSENGPHSTANGILLRADIHNLFDTGYITVTPQFRVEVSSRLKSEFENGHTYYPLHGKEIRLPAHTADHPSKGLLEWHNEKKYVG
jgi:putative restriction endonuclease